MTNNVITIDLNKPCAECGKAGACGNGLCLTCTATAMKPKPMKSQQGRALQAYWKSVKVAVKRERRSAIRKAQGLTENVDG